MFARTKRLTLRPGWPEDADALTAAIAHEAVVTKLSCAPWPYSLDDARAFLGRPVADREARLLIFTNDRANERDSPRLIGGIDVHRAPDGHALGYWLTPSAWGQGYATEAGRQMIEIARWSLGLSRLHARHFADNPRSGHVMHKLGFRPTGEVVPQFCRASGGAIACVRHVLDLTVLPTGRARLAA